MCTRNTLFGQGSEVLGVVNSQVLYFDVCFCIHYLLNVFLIRLHKCLWHFDYEGWTVLNEYSIGVDTSRMNVLITPVPLCRVPLL